MIFTRIAKCGRLPTTALATRPSTIRAFPFVTIAWPQKEVNQKMDQRTKTALQFPSVPSLGATTSPIVSSTAVINLLYPSQQFRRDFSFSSGTLASRPPIKRMGGGGVGRLEQGIGLIVVGIVLFVLKGLVPPGVRQLMDLISSLCVIIGLVLIVLSFL